MVAVDFGYSIESNPYFYEPDNNVVPFNSELHSCSTKIHMDMINGHLRKDKFTFIFEKYNNKNLYNIIKFNNNFNNYNIFMYNYFVYNKISSSIINLVTTQNSNIYVSYMY